MLELLRDKWKGREPENVDWLFDYWANGKRFWFDKPLGVRANSGMEGVNHAFKLTCTQRQILPVDEFIPLMTAWLAERSIMDCELHESVELVKRDWNDA